MVRELFIGSSTEPSSTGAQHKIVLFDFPIHINTDDNLGEGGNVWTAVQDLAAYIDSQVRFAKTHFTWFQSVT